MYMPPIETERLRLRPFTPDDLDAAHQLHQAVNWVNAEHTPDQQRDHRRRFLQWSALNHQMLADLHQPPYGDRALIRKADNALIGLAGFVPAFGPFAQLPGAVGPPHRLNNSEVGLVWAIHPAHRGKGYATEIGRALVDYAFKTLRLRRLIATTEYDNLPSQRVMVKLGMTIEKNPYPDPPWFQVVGIIDNPDL